jgi:hypothetical protein
MQNNHLNKATLAIIHGPYRHELCYFSASCCYSLALEPLLRAGDLSQTTQRFPDMVLRIKLFAVILSLYSCSTETFPVLHYINFCSIDNNDIKYDLLQYVRWMELQINKTKKRENVNYTDVLTFLN